jgi:hypothetical protein
VDCVEQAFELILPAIDSVRVMVAGELVVDRYTVHVRGSRADIAGGPNPCSKAYGAHRATR